MHYKAKSKLITSTGRPTRYVPPWHILRARSAYRHQVSMPDDACHGLNSPCRQSSPSSSYTGQTASSPSKRANSRSPPLAILTYSTPPLYAGRSGAGRCKMASASQTALRTSGPKRKPGTFLDAGRLRPWGRSEGAKLYRCCSKRNGRSRYGARGRHGEARSRRSSWRLWSVSQGRYVRVSGIASGILGELTTRKKKWPCVGKMLCCSTFGTGGRAMQRYAPRFPLVVPGPRAVLRLCPRASGIQADV